MYSKTKIIVYFILSFSWLALAYYIGRLIPDSPLWLAMLATFMFGLPMFFAAAYAVTVRIIHRSDQFHTKGLLHWLLTRRILAYIWWILWSVTFAFILLLYFSTTNGLEWIVLLSTVPVFAIIYAIFSHVATKEYKPYMKTHMSLTWTRWATTLVMTSFYILLIKYTGADQYISLSEATNTQEINGTSNSILVLETVRLISFFDGLKSYALYHLASLDNALYLAGVFIGSMLLFFNVSLVLSSFMIPASEYRRIFLPVQSNDNPVHIHPKSLGITSAFFTFFALFIYVPTILYLEVLLHSNPRIVERIHSLQTTVIEHAEMIGDNYYKTDTIAQIQQTKLDLISEQDLSIDELLKAYDSGFQGMISNVDDYLDWYYSLPAEYARIGAMVMGKLEKAMIKNLQDHLEKGNVFDQAQVSLEQEFQKNEQLHAEYEKKIEQILADNRFQPTSPHLDVIQRTSLDALKAPLPYSVSLDINKRLLTSGGAATVTGLIAAKVTAKVVGKGAIKLGAQALLKVAAGKAAGAAGGAAVGAGIGAAAGSVVPGIGTVIGAVIGGSVGGISIGIGVDYFILKLEEIFSREAFKAQILEAINEAQLELNNSLQLKSNE